MGLIKAAGGLCSSLLYSWKHLLNLPQEKVNGKDGGGGAGGGRDRGKNRVHRLCDAIQIKTKSIILLSFWVPNTFLPNY